MIPELAFAGTTNRRERFVLPVAANVELPKVKLITPNSLWYPTKVGLEIAWPNLDKDVRKLYDRWLKAPTKELKDQVMLMSGSLANFSSKSIQDSIWGKTAFTAATTIYFGLWAAALDDTLAGNTASEAAYTSYARLGLTNNTTIFAAGSGTTTYSKTFPSDAAKSFATSTGTGTNNTITFLGALDGNAGTSADHGYMWCSVTSTTINSGDTPQLAQNAVTVTQD
jgi:hypothetical protein